MNEIFCKHCLELVQVQNVRQSTGENCVADVYCEYCDLTYKQEVCCNEYLDYSEIDNSYDSELYFEDE